MRSISDTLISGTNIVLSNFPKVCPGRCSMTCRKSGSEAISLKFPGLRSAMTTRPHPERRRQTRGIRQRSQGSQPRVARSERRSPIVVTQTRSANRERNLRWEMTRLIESAGKTALFRHPQHFIVRTQKLRLTLIYLIQSRNQRDQHS